MLMPLVLLLSFRKDTLWNIPNNDVSYIFAGGAREICRFPPANAFGARRPERPEARHGFEWFKDII